MANGDPVDDRLLAAIDAVACELAVANAIKLAELSLLAPQHWGNSSNEWLADLRRKVGAVRESYGRLP